jgi:hypothetical protein
MKFKRVNTLFTLIMYYKLLKCLLMKYSLTTTLISVNENICIVGDSSGSKSSYGPVLLSYVWLPYSHDQVCTLSAWYLQTWVAVRCYFNLGHCAGTRAICSFILIDLMI